MSLWGSTCIALRGLMAELFNTYPQQVEGLFILDNLPLDTDNDLIVINDSLTPAVGTIVYLSGRVTDIKGSPIRNALIEIWQVDNNGVYLHSKVDQGPSSDTHFQGYGKFVTDKKEGMLFERLNLILCRQNSHIHVAVSINDTRILTTQCYERSLAMKRTSF